MKRFLISQRRPAAALAILALIISPQWAFCQAQPGAGSTIQSLLERLTRRPPTAPDQPPVPSLIREQDIASQITLAYQEALGREPDAAELAGWMADLQARPGAVDQRALVHWIMDWVRSPAGVRDNRSRIVRSYRAALTRDPSKEEIAYWIAETESKKPASQDDDEAHTYWQLLRYLGAEAASPRIAAVPRAGAPQLCRAGYVWREAYRGDYVCVSPLRREQTRIENALAASHRADMRSDDCARGYVWREVEPSDHVCVTPDIRSLVAEENRLAPHRTANEP